MNLVQSLTRAGGALRGFASNAGSTSTSVTRMKTAVGSADSQVGRLATTAGRTSTALGRIRTTANQSRTTLGQLRTSATQVDTSLGRARTGSDRLRGSLDRLRKSAGDTKDALRGMKQQADAVEKSVGKAGKGADGTNRSMGGLSKGVKGASLAQKGLNLAMMGSPFGLIMGLLAPLIAKFVNMDKIISVVQKNAVRAWNIIKDGTRAAIDRLKPLIEGYAKFMKLPINALIIAINHVIPYLNRIRVNIPGWVPGIGGKSFGVNLSKLPQLAKGGIVMPRAGGVPAVIGEAGEPEAVIPLSRLRAMVGGKEGPNLSPAWARLAAAVERMAQRPVHVNVDSQTIARAVFTGERLLARR